MINCSKHNIFSIGCSSHFLSHSPEFLKERGVDAWSRISLLKHSLLVRSQTYWISTLARHGGRGDMSSASQVNSHVN